MKTSFLFPFCFFLFTSLAVRAEDLKVADTVVGDVTVSAVEPVDWKLTASQETADGVSIVTVRLAAPAAAKPPKFTVSFACPGVGADHVWTPYDDRYWIRPFEWGATPYESQLAFRAPLAAAFRANGENVLALACSEAFDALKYGLTIGSSDCRLHGELAFFTEYAAPRTSYEAKIRIDTRKVRWSQGVSDAADWVSETAGLTPCAVPAAARDPMYSTWYAFWQDVKANVLEREAPLAAALGMKAMILDDGWQKEKSRTYYSATGDWTPVRGRFPDMKAHVAKIHAAGLKYILWLSVPFVGDESAAYARFKDKFLCEPDPGSGTYVLDVRFPEVREYLIATYERAVRDWGFDGLKLDFIDLLKIPATGDPAEKDGWKGRDIRSLPVAVDTLMKDVRRRLTAINPEVLIEFRQQYMGPAIRQYGNMIRATDCPADSDKIRKLVCDLRLTSGTTAVHSDMLVWHPDETPERAARPILNALFSTIQYSMVLARLPEEHREVIRHWLAFTQAHRATLLDGVFLPEHPETLYPLVAAESATERIAVAYTVGTVVPALADGKLAWAINATDAEGLVVDAAADGAAEIFDTFGRSRGKVTFSRGLVRLAVSPSGYAALRTPDALVVPAHQFDAGGWKLDVQFLDVIGAPYLLAHGLGNRVADATATVDVPDDGEYRVWAYTRNWADGAPGRFKVAVDGRVLPTEFGAGDATWGWGAGDTVALKRGLVTLSLKDLTGFDGRCAGLALTRGAASPAGAPDPRQLPVAETRTAEFVVVGGGLPGTCAAVAAARRGVKTVLVQDRPVLGGNASAEVRVWCAGEARYDLVRELRGMFMNMEDEAALSDARRMGIVLNEPNLTVLFSTRVFAAEKGADDAISSVTAIDLKRGRVVRIAAPLFADATGDGWLGFYAGADFRMGREARAEFGEPAEFAPEKADGDTLGASLMWTSANGNAPVAFSAPWAEPYAQGEVKVNGEWNWEYGIHRDMIAEGEAIRDRLLLAIYGSFSLAKKNTENANRMLNFVPFILGKRESRRLMGDYVYSGKDVVEKVQFEDAIAAGSWSVDLHYDTFKSGVDFLTTCKQPHFGRYWIPYRSIYSRNVPNLFVVGRCFSCTHVGLGGPRVINTLSQLGCAAGEAAALCKKYGIRPRGVYSDGRVRELQDALGGEFPGRPDPKTAGWAIVDDESAGVTFGLGWVKSHCALGEQVGDYAHFPGGHAWGPDRQVLPRCGEAVYPLPVPAKGRYALMGRIPFIRTTPDGSATAFEIVSGGRTVEFTVNQAYAPGVWHELGTFELEPGAVLKIIPKKSRGIVAADAFAIRTK